MAGIWSLISTAPDDFKVRAVWTVIQSINGAFRAIGYALLGSLFICVLSTGDDSDRLQPVFQAVHGDGTLRSVLAVHPLPSDGHAAAVQFHRIERHRRKGGDLLLPLDNEGQGGGHDAPDVQRPAIQNGEQPVRNASAM